jgi:SOS-response transcriptional repressor LexA
MYKLGERKLTSTQYETLKAIDQYIKTMGHAPTHHELAEVMRLPNARAVANRIDALVNKGYLDQTKFQPRGIRPSKKATSEYPELGRIAS